MKRKAAHIALVTVLAVLAGCYREVVSAKGLGAAAYDQDRKESGNYSGLPFDESTQRDTRRATIPGAR